MLVSNYKRLSYAGIALLVIFFICEAALTTDNTGLNIHFNIGIYVIIALIFTLIFLYLLLPLFYIRSYNRKLFISIIILGPLAMFLPALNSWDAISIWLKPKGTGMWANLDLFKTSAFKDTIFTIEHVIFICLFLCQLAIFIVTIRLKKQQNKYA